jgi:hypothetical protein
MKRFKRNKQLKKGIKNNFEENILLQKGTMAKIHFWENDKSPDTISSNFNRKLYYKYLKAIA